jgi:hypothetical protein
MRMESVSDVFLGLGLGVTGRLSYDAADGIVRESQQSAVGTPKEALKIAEFILGRQQLDAARRRVQMEKVADGDVVGRKS